MFNVQSAPLILIVSLALLALAGLVTVVWGRRLPRNGDWLVGIFLLVAGAALIFSGDALVDGGASLHAWVRGWIWPVSDEGALAAGIIEDPLGLVLAGLSLAFAAILLVGRGLLAGQPRLERFHGAIAFVAAGSALCWTAPTPWVGFVGISLVIFGGFVCLGSRWEEESESVLAIRFACERSFGLLLAILGACGLAGSRAPLVWASPGAAGASAPWFVPGSALTVSEIAGAVLLIAGLLIQLNPFPFLASTVVTGKLAPWVRVSLTQVFPAWAAFAILLRLQGHLGATVIFTVYGWILMGSALLSVVSGMLQPKTESAIGAWVAAGANLSAAALCLEGQQCALALVVGLGLGATAFAVSHSLMEPPPSKNVHANAGAFWIKAAGIAGICVATGALGFVSAGGAVLLFGQSLADPVLAAAAISAFALFAALGWKLAWTLSRQKTAARPPAFALALPGLLIVLGLGLLWTGTVTGGALPGASDRVTASLMDLLFGKIAPSADDTTAFTAYLGVLVLAIGAAYWASLKIREPVSADGRERIWRGVFRFIVSGYGTDRAADHLIAGLTWFSGHTQELVDTRLWRRWIPNGLSFAMHALARATLWFDAHLSNQLRRVFHRWIDAGSRLLQVIQNGDVQWYLLFGVGSGFAILAHFLLRAP